jgi:hypothetical protein
MGSRDTSAAVAARRPGASSPIRAGGLPDKVAGIAADILPLYATAYAFEQGVYAERVGENPEEYFEEIDRFFHALPAARFPNIAALADAIAGGDSDDEPDARFEFGLDLLVRGLAAHTRR